MAAIGLGDLKILLSQYFATIGAVEFSGAVAANTPFGQFTASVSGNVSILVAVDDSQNLHLSMADLTLDSKYRGVDEYRAIRQGQWEIYKSVVVKGHQYAFQMSGASTSASLTVVYTPLAP